MEFGSLGIERGMASEITTFDDDGWVTGERIRIKDPKHLFFTEVGYTNAYFGEIGTPNVFRRGQDFTEFNYRQVYGKKQLNPYIGFSADYTYIGGTDTTRQAIEIGAKATKIFDTIRVEAYQRLDTVNLQGLKVGSGSGYAVTLAKQLTGRISGDVGFDSVDANYSVYAGHRVQHAVGMSMNGDSYGQGERPFIHGSVKLNSFITAYGFYTHALDNVLDLNQQNLNGGLTFDLKAMANLKTRVF